MRTRAMLAAGANKEAEDKEGHTPLYVASLMGHEGVVKLLTDAGACKEAEDKKGRTPKIIFLLHPCISHEPPRAT